MRLEQGTTVDRYVVQRAIASGGLATVYLVKHTVLGTQHALKVLDHVSPSVANRLLQEGQLQAKLNPRFIVPVTDILDVGGQPALLMPLVHGCSLRGVLDGYQPSTLETAIVLRDVALALEAAHDENIIHRDLKPGNILLEIKHGRLSVRISDFGIARLQERSLGTNDQALLGTIAYASPEQIESPSTVGPRGDLWSLGVVAYELLCGHRPFDRAGEPSPIIRILSGNYDKEPIPEPWRELVHALLQVEPAMRPQAAGDVASRIEAFITTELSGDAPILRAIRLAEQRLNDRNIEPAPDRGTLQFDESKAPNATLPVDQVLQTSRDGRADTQIALERNLFVRRPEVYQHLHDSLLDGTGLLTILGIGGSGKSRTMLHYANEYRQFWTGGVHHCDLADATTWTGVLRAIARAYGVPLHDHEPDKQLMLTMAHKGLSLLILDNVENVAESTRDFIVQCRQVAPKTSIAITSRIRLGISGERTWVIPHLTTPDARALFIDRAQIAKGHFSPSDAETRVIDELVASLDHLPLAIEMAAAQTRIMSPMKILARMNQRFRLLSHSFDEHPRQQTLRSMLDYSWDLLNPSCQTALAQLSVFEGGFDLDAADAVIEIPESLVPPWTIDIIRSLVDQSWLRVSGDDRFTMLLSVQAYAREKHNDLQQSPSAEARHGSYYAEAGSEAAIMALHHHGGLALKEGLRRDFDNLMIAWKRSISRRDPITAAGTALALSAVILETGPYGSGTKIIEDTLQLDGHPTVTRARLADSLGSVLRHQGRLTEAKEAYNQAFELGSSADHALIPGHALSNLARLAFLQKDYESGLRLATDALARARANQDQVHEGRVLTSLAQHLIHTHELQEAEEYLQTALALCEQTGDEICAGYALSGLGVIDDRLNRVPEAITHYSEALKLLERHGHRGIEVPVRCNLGLALAGSGQLDQAEAHLQSALQIAHDVGSLQNQGRAHGVLARIYLVASRYAAAERHASQARELCEHAFPHFVPSCLRMLGQIAYKQEEWALAEHHLRQGLRSAHLKNVMTEGMIRANLALVLARIGKTERATQAMAQAEQVLRNDTRAAVRGELLGTKAAVLARCGDIESANNVFKQAMALHESLVHPDIDVARAVDEARAALGLSQGATP